jgi:hypothetical protein
MGEVVIMPRIPKYEMAWASCLFCREKFLTRYHKTTCNCKEARAAQHHAWRKKDLAWRRDYYGGKIHHMDKVKLKGHKARCGHISPNFFNCSACLAEKMEHGGIPQDVLGYSLGEGW